METRTPIHRTISADSLLKPLGERTKAVRRQKFMVFLANFGTFVLGVVNSLPSITLQQLRNTEEPVHFDQSQASWFASVNFMTCPLGSLLIGSVLDVIGRRKTLIVMNILAIISWTLMATAVQDDSYSVFIQLLVSRCVSGICIGISGAPECIYGAEISLPKYRGRMLLWTAFARSSGITFTYTVGYFIRKDYHLIAELVLCLQIVSLIALIPLVETPSWLLLVNRDVEAKKSLTYFRGLNEGEVNQELEDEFNRLQEATHLKLGEKKPPFHKALLLPEVYKPLLIMMGLFLCQQGTGIIILIVYAVDIGIAAGVEIEPILCAIILGSAAAITVILMMWLLEWWGRRVTLIVSASGMAIGMFILTGAGWFTWFDLPYLRVAALLFYIVSSAFGLQVLPYFLIGEVFPHNFRGPCAGIITTFGFLTMFISVKTYPFVKDAIGSANIFLFFGVMSVLSIVHVYMFLPETRGKTLLEIEKYFHGSD